MDVKCQVTEGTDKNATSAVNMRFRTLSYRKIDYVSE